MENLTPYGYIKNGKVFLKEYLDQPEREIGEVKESETAAIEYFIKRFSLAEKKVADLSEAIVKAENKGSYLQKLIHLREYLRSFDGLGDFPVLFATLDKEEVVLRELVSKNRVKNLALKKAILTELDEIKDSSDWINASEKVKEIKNKWIKVGSADKEADEELEQQFKEMLDLFYARRNEFYEERNRLIQDKILKYRELVKKAQELKDAEDINATVATFKKLHEQWKAIGSIPKSELSGLWSDFKASNDHFFKRFKDLRKNKSVGRPYYEDPRLKQYEELAGQAEQLLAEFPEGVADKAKLLLEAWKKLGIFKHEKMKAILPRFRNACDKIFELEYLNRMIDRRAPNFDLKPPREQLRIRIGLMKELITKDREEINHFEDTFKTDSGNKDNESNRIFAGKIDMKKRRLRVKEDILKEMEGQYQRVG